MKPADYIFIAVGESPVDRAAKLLSLLEEGYEIIQATGTSASVQYILCKEWYRDDD